VLLAVGAVIVAGRLLVRPALRAVARTRLRELFTAAALLLVIGIALLMTRVGLSPALGTFLAGAVLANSEYRHELVSDVEPFKGLLLGLFFIAVGASIDFRLLATQPGPIAGLVLGALAVKLLILAVLARPFGMSTDQGLLFAFSLPRWVSSASSCCRSGSDSGSSSRRWPTPSLPWSPSRWPRARC
jgi:Kef-type K+ transport system membrane component KefB